MIKIYFLYNYNCPYNLSILVRALKAVLKVFFLFLNQQNVNVVLNRFVKTLNVEDSSNFLTNCQQQERILNGIYIGRLWFGERRRNSVRMFYILQCKLRLFVNTK